MSTPIVLALILGAVILGVAAVIIDRLNFPQRRFVPRHLRVDADSDRTRDRTGAHIIDLAEQDAEQSDPPDTTG